MQETLKNKALELLHGLIEIPSFSKQEDKTADRLEAFLKSEGIEVFRENNNVWAFNRHFDPSKPNILLNSHHDTVKPNKDTREIPMRLRSSVTSSTASGLMTQVGRSWDSSRVFFISIAEPV